MKCYVQYKDRPILAYELSLGEAYISWIQMRTLRHFCHICLCHHEPVYSFGVQRNVAKTSVNYPTCMLEDPVTF